MKGATLFSGIGAPECAAPFIDWRWSSEIDDFANAVRAHHWPGVPNLGDVGAINAEAVERPDVIVFGSPCQSFSVAGKRLGLADPRGNLALIALSLVAELRPRWFVFENVPGLLSSADGEDFAAFLRAVRQCGYTGAYRVLDAQHFGVPQRRRRVFFVGRLGDDWRPSAAVLFEPESLSGHPAPGREAGEDVAASVAASAGHHGYSSPRGDGSDNLIASDVLAPSLRAQSQSSHRTDSEAYVASTGPLSHCLNAGGMGRQDFETETLVAFDTTQVTSKGNYSNPKPGDPCHPLAAGAHAPAVAFNWQSGGDCRGLEPQPITMALQREQTPAMQQGPMVRRLTPTECERLQGFSPTHQRVRIVAWPVDKCPQPAGVAIPCTTGPSSASSAGGGEWWRSANIAAALSSISPHDLGGRAALHARISLDHADRLTLSLAKYGSNASTAASESLSLPPTRSADIAQAAALIRPIREARTQAGGEGWLQNAQETSAVLNGGLLVHLSTSEIRTAADAVERLAVESLASSTSTTSDHGPSSPISDTRWKTWSCFVAAAITGSIPGGMPSDCFLVADVEVETGFTDIPWRGKPAPDGRRYKALGNSMAVPCIRWILERLWIVDRETSPHHTRRQNPGASAGRATRQPRPGRGFLPSCVRADKTPPPAVLKGVLLRAWTAGNSGAPVPAFYSRRVPRPHLRSPAGRSEMGVRPFSWGR